MYFLLMGKDLRHNCFNKYGVGQKWPWTWTLLSMSCTIRIFIPQANACLRKDISPTCPVFQCHLWKGESKFFESLLVVVLYRTCVYVIEVTVCLGAALCVRPQHIQLYHLSCLHPFSVSPPYFFTVMNVIFFLFMIFVSFLNALPV